MTGFSNSTAFPRGRRAKLRPRLGCLRGDLRVLAGPAAPAPSAAAAVRAAEEDVIDGGVELVARAEVPGKGVREEVGDEARNDAGVCPTRIGLETSPDSPATPPVGRTPPPRKPSDGSALGPTPLLLSEERPVSHHAAPPSARAEDTLGLESRRSTTGAQLPGAPCPDGTLPSPLA